MAQQKFLNYDGLLALWAKIKAADEVNAGLIAELQEQISNLPSDYSKVDDLKIVDGSLVLFAGQEQVGTGVSISEFIKDGMVDDISIVEATPDSPINGETSGKFIKFSWNIAGGSKIEYLAVADLGIVDLNPLISRLDAVEANLLELQAELDKAQTDIEALKAATGAGEVSYEEITKDDEGNYVGESNNAPKTSSVVTALNELKAAFAESIDLSDYYNKSEVDNKLDLKLNQSDIIEVEVIEGLF